MIYLIALFLRNFILHVIINLSRSFVHTVDKVI